jgi:drug/metabolite transporter (DMT)-like permease
MNIMDSRAKNLFKIHIAVLLFGLTGLFGKFLDIPAHHIVLGRVFFASVSMGLYFYLRRISVKLNSRKDYIVILMLGALLAFHWTAFYRSVQVSTVAIALLTFSAYPIFVTFFEPIIFKEKLKKTDILLAIVMFIGVMFIVPDFDLSNNLTIGTIWGMVGCLTFAVMALLNRQLASKYAGSVIAFYEQGIATIVLLPTLIISRPEMTLTDWWLVILLGVVFTGLAHSLFIGGMKVIRAQTAGIIASLESVYGIIFAAIILHEIPSARELIGGAIILGTAFLSTMKSSKELTASK